MRVKMAIEVNGKKLETDDKGHLLNIDEWDEEVAGIIAEKEGINLTDKHWDVIHYLREEYLENNGKQPNLRTMVKDLKDVWSGESVDSKTLYDLFPNAPDKQGSKIGGLPKLNRKDGY
jgi:tRNA 2-thiouridine synthesizing protein E